MPAWLVPAAGAAISAAGLLGNKSSGSDAAMKYLQMAYDEFGRLRVPTPEEMQVQVQQLIQQGILQPEDAKVILANPTAFLNVDEDPAVRNAQLGALGKLQGITEGGGLDAQGKADIGQIINEINTSNKGNRGAIVQNAAQRGVGGSGLELANQLSSAQEASTNASQQGMDAAALAEKRSLEAIMNTGQLAGNIRSQDYTKAADKAAAIDAIDKFNTQNKNTVGMSNVAARNAAAAQTLAEKQRLADTNVTNTNANRVRNANLIQQNFENEMKKKAGMTGQLGNMANIAAKQDDQDEAFRNALIGAGGQMLSGYRGK